jgi:hypothetical protein
MSASQHQQQYVVSIKFKRFILDEGARPQGNTAQRSLLAKPFAVAWSMVAHGPQAFAGTTCGSSFKSTANVLQCDWRSATTAEIVLDHSVLSNAGTRVVLFRIMELEAMNPAASETSREEDPAAVLQFLRSSVGGRGKGAPVLASATVDPGAFLKQPARDYCVKMESQFATVGKLYFNLVVELLEAKRFGERAILERRLVLRIDRVVPNRQANNGLRHRSSQPIMSSGGAGGEQQQPASAASGQQAQRSASSSLISPLGIGRAGSNVSSASNGSSLGPATSTPLVTTPLSPALRPGGEYTIKVRLSSGKTVYRTPLSICDPDGRIRWNYELTIPLPQDAPLKKSTTSSTSPPVSVAAVPLDPNITTASNSSLTSHPGGAGGVASNDSTASSVTPTPLMPTSSKSGVSFPGTKDCKLQVALLEGQQVVSAFGIDVARLRCGRSWTEVAVPSPFSAIRYEKDGSMQTALGSVLFEWSVRETEALKLKAESPLGTPTGPSRTNSNRESGESTPVLPSAVTQFQQQPQSRTASPGGIRRKTNAQIDVAPIVVSHSPLSPSHHSPTRQPTTAKSDASRPMRSVHSFGESLCSNPPTPLNPSIPVDSPPPHTVAGGQRPSALHQQPILVESASSPIGRAITMPPTPSAGQSGPMTLSSANSLWEPFGGGPHIQPTYADPHLMVESASDKHSSARPLPLPTVVAKSPTYMGLDRREDVSPTPGLSNTQLPGAPNLYDAARRLSATESYAHLQIHDNAPPQYHADDLVSALSTVDRSDGSVAKRSNGHIVTRNIDRFEEGGNHISHPAVAHNDELQQQVNSQNQRINELQRQLALLQQQQSASRSTSMMSSATVRTTGTAQSSLLAGWGSSSLGIADGSGARWRSPSSDANGGYYRSGSETGSRRATPLRTHSLSREEVQLAAPAEGSRRLAATSTTSHHADTSLESRNILTRATSSVQRNVTDRTPPREHPWVAERSSPAPEDPRRRGTTLVTDEIVATTHDGRIAPRGAPSRLSRLEAASKSRWR